MELTRQIRSGAHGWKYVSRDDSLRKGRWICGEGAGGGWCRNKRTGAVAGWGRTVFSAAVRSGCGRFKRAGLYFAISKHGSVPCRKARRIINSFFFNRGAWKLHGDGTIANSYYTRHKYAGWRCATASGAGGCTYRGGKRRIGYVTQARSLDPRQKRLNYKVRAARRLDSRRANSTVYMACYIPDSPRFLVKPRKCWVTVAGTTRQVFLSKMHWSSWTRTGATGKGRIDYFDHPELGGRVKVRLSKPKRQSCLTIKSFAKATFRQLSGGQKGSHFSLRILNCPHAG